MRQETLVVSSLDVIGRLFPELLSKTVAIRQRERNAISEAAGAAQSSKIMIERAVLLHEDDNVLHIHDGAGRCMRRNLERPGNAGINQSRGRNRAYGVCRQIEKFAACLLHMHQLSIKRLVFGMRSYL